ncbi:MAG: D-aminopeptidase [Planctomycetota bacterium]|jgi:D-aminopeptidase
MTETTLNQLHSNPIRARDLGIPFAGSPGRWNAITDVPGIQVGYTTLIEDLPPDEIGPVAVRTGVTAILPDAHNRQLLRSWAGFSSFNGNGELTGAHWINEAGFFLGPILLTNTHSVGMAHHACLQWLTRRAEYEASNDRWLLPVVAETCDDELNDINGFHVEVGHVVDAIESAASGTIAEGNVGGGTGMRCYEFKGGTGTASRMVKVGDQSYTLAALVQANFGLRKDLTIAGKPVGRLSRQAQGANRDSGSLIVIIATDAPLLPLQLQRIARRCAIGMARTGTPGYDGSGDLFLAFTTARAQAGDKGSLVETMPFLPSDQLDALFEATVQSTEEAIVNALVAAQSMVGHRGRSFEGVDLDWLAGLFDREL